MNNLKLVLPAILLALSTSVNAVVINTLNGQQYEWLEVTETLGQSRVQVEAMLTDSTSNLYGYQYASRSLIEDLFLSYTSWDGVDGFHVNSSVMSGIASLINDFGTTFTQIPSTTQTISDLADSSGSVSYQSILVLDGYMGTTSECGLDTCRAAVSSLYYNGINVGAYQGRDVGWDSEYTAPLTFLTTVRVHH